MSRAVLVVESDFDVLGALSSELRARGLNVVIADSAASALERARIAAPDAVIIAAHLLESEAARAKFAADSALANAAIFTLCGPHPSRALQPNELDAEDVDDIARRILALPGRASSAVTTVVGGDVRGNLQQLSILDLLQLLSMNRRSGSLSITTQAGAGEVRLAEGEVVDAVYRRLEGEKALYRLLGETEGVFSFASGTAQSLRRILPSTRTLLLEGVRQIDETRARRAALDCEEDAFLANVPVESVPVEAAQRVLEVLLAPRTLAELLDEVPLADLEVLEALAALLEGGQVRRIVAGAERVELADAERLAVLAALAKRAARSGFRAPPRVAIAAPPGRFSALAHAVGRIADAVAPTEILPNTPVPHTLATLRLAEGGELAVVGVPLVEAYAPLWALILPGCAAVARLGAECSETLERACIHAGVPLVDASDLLTAEDDPEQVAAVIRLLLERAAES